MKGMKSLKIKKNSKSFVSIENVRKCSKMFFFRKFFDFIENCRIFFFAFIENCRNLFYFVENFLFL